MTNSVIAWLEAKLSELKTNPVVETVETDVEAIGSSAIAYIEQNGGKAAYSLAMSFLAGVATGTPWATIGADFLTQAETAGITIAKGAESVILAQAQADLVAQGTIVAPTTGVTAPVTPPVAAPAA